MHLRTVTSNNSIPLLKVERQSSKRFGRVKATSGSATTSSTEALKRRLVELSGSKNGTDKSPGEKQQVVKVAEELAALNRIEPLDMTGSRWELVFTESLASSSGKIGPFVGRTEQEFPQSQPGQYLNWCYLGPVALSLLADYTQATPEEIIVSFQYLQVQAGPFKWKKELKNRGTWDSMYIDPEFRVFRANKKNVFVLKKMA